MLNHLADEPDCRLPDTWEPAPADNPTHKQGRWECPEWLPRSADGAKNAVPDFSPFRVRVPAPPRPDSDGGKALEPSL
eukprot:1057527-Amphidinium_carterae.1